MSSETDWSLNFSFDWFKMLPKVLKWILKKVNQKVFNLLQKLTKAKNRIYYAYIFA